MSFLSTLDIAGSAMTAQKRRLDTIAENIANRETTRTEAGGPYRRKLSVFQEIVDRNGGMSGSLRSTWDSAVFGSHTHLSQRAAGSFADRVRYLQERQQQANGGVMVSEIIEDESPLVPVYDPTHPDANEDGYVMMPNVNTTVEMVDAMAATRSFSANVAVFEAIKMVTGQALELGR